MNKSEAVRVVGSDGMAQIFVCSPERVRAAEFLKECFDKALAEAATQQTFTPKSVRVSVNRYKVFDREGCVFPVFSARLGQITDLYEVLNGEGVVVAYCREPSDLFEAAEYLTDVCLGEHKSMVMEAKLTD